MTDFNTYSIQFTSARRGYNNIKTDGSPWRGTKRKLSRLPQFNGIKGCGAGEPVPTKMPIHHMWAKNPRDGGQFIVGWWNYDLHCGHTMKRWDPVLAKDLHNDVDLRTEVLWKRDDYPWATQKREKSLQGVQELGNQRHSAQSREAREYRDDSIIAAQRFTDEFKPSNRAYIEQMRLRRHESAMQVLRDRGEQFSSTYTRYTNSKWHNLHTYGSSGLGKATNMLKTA